VSKKRLGGRTAKPKKVNPSKNAPKKNEPASTENGQKKKGDKSKNKTGAVNSLSNSRLTVKKKLGKLGGYY